jgi:hypothetical protein
MALAFLQDMAMNPGKYPEYQYKETREAAEILVDQLIEDVPQWYESLRRSPEGLSHINTISECVILASMKRTKIPKVDQFHRGSAGWFLSDGTLCHPGVNLICGGCGKHIGDCRNHTITDGGEVNASILCPCGWHVWGLLEEWEHEPDPAKGQT